MADVSPATIILEGFPKCAAHSFGAHYTTAIEGVVTVGTPPADVPARRRVTLVRTWSGAAIEYALSDPVTGEYRFENVPPGHYEVVVMGFNVHRSEVVGPMGVS